MVAALYFLDWQGQGLVGTANGAWSTDGSEAGTTQISDQRIRSPFIASPAVVPPSGEVFFRADTISTPSDLYVTDGTAKGTAVVVEDAQGRPALLSGLLLFLRDTAAEGSEPWAYPTAGGPAYLVGDLDPGDSSSQPTMLGTFGSLMIFSAREPAQGRELWATDGDPAGTFVVKDIFAGPESSSPSTPDFATPAPWTPTGLYFVADDGLSGEELWLTDGTEDGTTRVVDLRAGPLSSAPSSVVAIGERVAFLADDGVHGRELWWTSGSGATLVRDVRSGAESSSPLYSNQPQVVAAGHRAYFAATDGVSGLELWVSDLTAEGTHRVQDIIPDRALRRPVTSKWSAIGSTFLPQTASMASSSGR